MATKKKAAAAAPKAKAASKGKSAPKGKAAAGGGKRGLIIAGVMVAVLAGLALQTYFLARRQAKLKFDMVRVGRIIPQGHDIGQGGPAANFEGDKQDNLFYLETDGAGKSRVLKFDPMGNPLGVFEPKKPEQLLINAKDLTTDAAGNVYVIQDDGQVQVMDKDLKWVRNIRTAVPGPTSIGVDSAGRIYIASDPGNKVVVLAASGSVEGEFGAPGTKTGDIVGPVRLRVTADDQIAVLERLPAGLRVKVFSADRSVKRMFDIKNLQNCIPLKMGVNSDNLAFFNDHLGPRGMVVYDLDSGKFVGDAQATKDGQKFVSPGAVGGNKWTPSVYLHSVPGLIKCLMPSGEDSE